MGKTYNEIVKAIGELDMPFKEKVTNNIYDSWKSMIYPDAACVIKIPGLDGYSVEELTHLKWLIEEQIKVKKKEKEKNEIS